MPILKRSLHAWNTGTFNRVIGDEIIKLEPGTLPLQTGTTQGGMIDDSDMTVSVLSATDNNGPIQARIGVFFSEIVGGCNCNDDPYPVNAYCELQVIIDKTTAEAVIKAESVE